MALFRLHKGGLDESLATTVVIKNERQLFEEIAKQAPEGCSWGAEVEIKPYPDNENNFDPRTGWHTHIVLANIVEQDKMHPVGFLSEFLY